MSTSDSIGIVAILLAGMGITTIANGQTPWPAHLVEDQNWTSGPHYIGVTPPILSPGSASHPVSVSDSAQVEFVSATSILLKEGLYAGDFSGDGFFEARIDTTLGADADVVVVSPEQVHHFGGNTLHVNKWEKLEVGLRLPQDYRDAIDRFFDHYYSDTDPYVATPDSVDAVHDLNPYADDSLQLVMTLTSPSGAHTLKWGYFMREGKWTGTSDISLPVEDTTDVLYPYHIRFRTAPDEEGVWQFSLALQAPHTTTASNETVASALYTGYTFVCDPPLADNHGPLQVNDVNRRTLKFEDGTPYFGLGTNLEATGYGTGWSDPNSYRLVRRNFLNVTSAMQRLHSVGGNFARLFQLNKSLAPENSSLGVYDRFNDPVDCARVTQEKGSGQRNSWVMDMLADTARKYGIEMQLCIVPYPPIIAYEAWAWLNDPYLHHFVAPRDPATQLYDMKRYFYSSGDTTTADSAGSAFYYWKRKYKYIMDRWGYSVNIPIIEPFNEIDQMLTYHHVDMTDRHKANNCGENNLNWPTDPALPGTYSAWLSDIIHYVKDPVDLSDPANSPLGESSKLFLVGTGPDRDANNNELPPNSPDNPDWNLPNTNPDVDLVDVHNGLYWGEGELFGSFDKSQNFRNSYTSSDDESKRPFHQGESNYYEFVDIATYVGADTSERYVDAASYYDNYDVSFHNEIWASTFFGNFAAATSWQKERIFWWGGTQPPSETLAQNPQGFNHTNVLNAINTLNPNGVPVQVRNRTLYHNFKPLSDFLANPNLQAYNLFNADLSPHKVVDTNKIETYYLTNADSTFAIGWVHNLNAYWEDHFYVKNDSALQNFFGCTAPGAQQVAVPGLQAGLDYHITWFPTRMNDTIHPADAVDTSGTGVVLLDMSTTPLGDTANKYLDTLRLDYAFIIALQPVHSNRQVPVVDDNQEVIVSDWDFGLFPNPASEHLNVILPDEKPADIALYDLSGRRICGWQNMKGPRMVLPIGQLAPGAYYLRVSTVKHNKTKPLIIH